MPLSFFAGSLSHRRRLVFDDLINGNDHDHGSGSSMRTRCDETSLRSVSTAIKDFEVLHLRDEACEAFVNAVLNPPAPSDAALAARERYKKNMGL